MIHILVLPKENPSEGKNLNFKSLTTDNKGERYFPFLFFLAKA